VGTVAGSFILAFPIDEQSKQIQSRQTTQAGAPVGALSRTASGSIFRKARCCKKLNA
jgi:hypothetical protein